MTTTYNILHMPDMVDIGYQTESGVREIGLDVKPWLEAYGDLTLSIWLTRPGEDVAYPAADIERMGTVLYWTPNGADTAIDGVGRVEVLGLTVEKRKLSGWCKTLVRATSLAKTQDPPEAAAPWVDSVLGAAERITGMQVAAETLEAGSDATAQWDGDAGLLTLGIPSGSPGPKGDMGPAGPAGPKGDAFAYADFTAEQLAALKGQQGDPGPAGADGVSPTVTTSKSGKVTTITIVDAAGTKTATINDGADGAKGDPGDPGAPGKDAVVDATLTQEGQAADAKVTGDAVRQLKDDLSDLAPAGAAVGQLFRVAAISEDGKYTMEPVDMPSVPVQDVQVNGKSIVDAFGKAMLPNCDVNKYGLIKGTWGDQSGTTFANETLYIVPATNHAISSRIALEDYSSGPNNRHPIVPSHLDFAVKAAMCDGKGEAWTDAYRISALLRMGCTVDENGFVKWAAQEVAE